MDIRGWEERYRSRARAAEDYQAAPTPLVMQVSGQLAPGRALDLASGAGRNALWLAQHGWQVTAVDGAATAIAALREQARTAGLAIDARVADLKQHTFTIEPAAFDLVTICYYLQRDLFARAKSGVRAGGVLLAIVHTTEGDEEPTESRLPPGELAQYFNGWEILHLREGRSSDTAHKRSVAEIVARKPDD
jgi:SAM-dependent methyltransferase